MSYNSVVAISTSQSLVNRVAACAASEGQAEPWGWAQQHILDLAVLPDWIAAWEHAEGNKTVNVNPDTGLRDDVVNDQMILSAVQAILAEEKPS